MDARSSEEITTAKNEEETPVNEIIVAVEPEIVPTVDIKNEAPKMEIKEPIAIVSSELPQTETPVATQNKTEEALLEEEDKPLPIKEVPEEEVKEIPVTIAEEPIAILIVEKKNEEEVKKEEVVSDAKIVFKVQLLASSRVLPLLSEEFNGLSTLSTERYKNLVRYMYGKTNSYSQAKLYKANADAKGYSTSFIVAYKDGKRIPVTEALKYVSE